MHTTLKLLCLLAFTTLVHASDPQAILAADDARIAAMKSGEKAALEALFSDDLHYAHSNGIVDTKASFIDILASKKTRYLVYQPGNRAVTFPTADIALMSGRAVVKAVSEKGEMQSTLTYLAVWRMEQGSWKFLAWQSGRLPPPEAK